MDKIYRPEFLGLDVARQVEAEILRALGFGPQERPYQVSVTGSRWRLRDYGGGVRASFLVVGGQNLQHVALLVGRHARATVWPQIVAWADQRTPCRNYATLAGWRPTVLAP
jgi:hypothetical protein